MSWQDLQVAPPAEKAGFQVDDVIKKFDGKEASTPAALLDEFKKKKPGDEVTVSGYGAKDGSHTMNARVVKTADGRQILAGSSGPGAPPGEAAPPDKPEAK